MEIFLFWVIFAIVVAVIASSRGRFGFGWFLLSLVISPLLTFILVLCLPRVATERAPHQATHIKCPDCAELVLKEARVCKHCGRRLEPAPASASLKCPTCKGEIQRGVGACKHCGRALFWSQAQKVA